MPSSDGGERRQRPEVEELLRRGIARLELTPTPSMMEGLIAYLDLLGKWNRAFNLSSIKDPEQMVIRHVLDSLAVGSYVEGPRLLDMGSGAGLPGVPLALAKPGLEVVLLDSNGKKTRFLRQTVLELGIGGVTVVHERAETFRPGAAFDTIISRAFAELRRYVSLASPLSRPGGRILAMKGPLAEGEAAGLKELGWDPEIFEIQVPGLDAARRLVRVTSPFNGRQ